jgi:hypothetical protein
MSRSVESIVSDIVNGTPEERVRALDAFVEQTADVLRAAATALAADQATRYSVAERVAELSNKVRLVFAPVFVGATDPEVKILSAVLAARAGSREPVAWLLDVARASGPPTKDSDWYFATTQLAFMNAPEVRSIILDRLRMLAAGGLRALSTRDVDFISGLLDAWATFGEPLPEDVSTMLHADDAPLGVKVALKSLNL